MGVTATPVRTRVWVVAVLCVIIAFYWLLVLLGVLGENPKMTAISFILVALAAVGAVWT